MSAIAIAHAAPRRRVTVSGEVTAVASFQLPYVRTEATISDGTGVMLLRFMGRADVPGLVAGRRVVAHGTPAVEGRMLLIRNPLYSFAVAS